MSADNYYRVCRHPLGGYTAVMGFMSNDEQPEPKNADPQFATWQTAYAYADKDAVIEYGIQVDPDIISSQAAADANAAAAEDSDFNPVAELAEAETILARLRNFAYDIVTNGHPDGDRTPQYVAQQVLDILHEWYS